MMECQVIEADVKKESDEPFCQHCIDEHAKRIAVMLGKQEEEKAKSYPPPPPNETEILKQRNQLLEMQARKQEKEFNEYKAKSEERFEKLANLLQQLISK